MKDPTRRDVFVSLAAMIAGLMLPGVLVAGPATGIRADDSWLDAVVPDISAAGRLGRAYLAAYPAEFDPKRLVVEVLKSLRLSKGSVALDSIPEGVLIARAREVVTEDYLTGRVVHVDGWVLSLTEARCYALSALADNNFR